MNIVFLGTPDFAVASLKALVDNQFNVVAVVTAPDKPAGRGMHLQQSAVKKYAQEQHIPVLQPERLKDPSFIEELKSYQADIQVVVAFRMLPEVVWNMPSLGTINVHASLLPEYRGAAPINWAIINGESKTGVTTFKLKHQIDTGNILLQQAVDIDSNETAGILHDKLMHLGADLIVKTLHGIQEGTITEHEQAISASTKHAPKIFTSTCEINWNQSSQLIHNQIRGLSPYPTAFTRLNNKVLKLFLSSPHYIQHSFSPGTIHSDGKSYMHFASNDGFIEILELQLEGKKRMKIDEFLRGNKVN